MLWLSAAIPICDCKIAPDANSLALRVCKSVFDKVSASVLVSDTDYAVRLLGHRNAIGDLSGMESLLPRFIHRNYEFSARREDLARRI